MDEALTSALGRACTIEGRLRSASQGYNKLTEVKADAQTAADMVEKTAALARDVSAKVRQLDLARVTNLIKLGINVKVCFLRLHAKTTETITKRLGMWRAGIHK